MNASQAWRLLLVFLAGWVNRHQLDVIAYIQEENRVLKSKLKGKRIRFTDNERPAASHDILDFCARVLATSRVRIEQLTELAWWGHRPPGLVFRESELHSRGFV